MLYLGQQRLKLIKKVRRDNMKATLDVKGSLGIDAELPNDQQENAGAQKPGYVIKTEVKTMSTFPKTTDTDSLMISFLGIFLVGVTITVKYFWGNKERE
jgi:hypothetical protein